MCFSFSISLSTKNERKVPVSLFPLSNPLPTPRFDFPPSHLCFFVPLDFLKTVSTSPHLGDLPNKNLLFIVGKPIRPHLVEVVFQPQRGWDWRGFGGSSSSPNPLKCSPIQPSHPLIPFLLFGTHSFEQAGAEWQHYN